jgi:hypothetical protein
VSNFYYTAGLRSVGCYQVAGAPYITGSSINNGVEVKLEFPKVAKSVTVHALSSSDGTGVDIHFNPLSSGRVADGIHYKRLSHMENFTFNVKCKEIYISNPASGTQPLGFTVVAELTTIPTGSMFALTGSGLTD